MTRLSREQVEEQIRRDAAKAALECPEPSRHQLQQVADLLDAVRSEKKQVA